MKRIGSIKDLKTALAENNAVLIEVDGGVEMARVSFNGHHVMEGNDWDFYPGCHGGWFNKLAERHGDFDSPRGLAEAIVKAVASMGADCRIDAGTYDWKSEQ